MPFPYFKPRLTLLVAALLALSVPVAKAQVVWVTPTGTGLSVESVDAAGGVWRITSAREGEFTLESQRSHGAAPGDCFEVNVRLRAGLGMRALPELVCYDREGREIPVASSLARGTLYVTTDWQAYQRIYPVQPGTAMVRARIRGSGRGTIDVAGLEFNPRQIDPYTTGALITQPHPKLRSDVVLESNFGIVNPGLVSSDDRDSDGKWALVTINLDRLTEPKHQGEDWRTRFEDNPNVILWSDGAVLKSDTVGNDRPPSVSTALHFRTQVHPGPYTVMVSDPGRSVALSLDGKNWKRYEGGGEIELGELPMADGIVELWLDGCYRDPVSVGPVYFDYVRMRPTRDGPSIERLLAAASRKVPQVERGATDERTVPVTVDVPVIANGGEWPVRCGLPIPRGELLSAEHVAVCDVAGRKIASQNRVSARWPDGSAKWIYLDFIHRLSDRPDYTISYGNKVQALSSRAGVALEQRADGLEVATGAIRFSISGKRFGLIENVRLEAGQVVQSGPIAAEIVEVGGRVWRGLNLPVERLVVENPGPLHATIVVETKMPESGKPAEGFYHRARIHVYAGSPVVQIDYFVVNTDSRVVEQPGGSMAGKIAVESFSLKTRTAGEIVAMTDPDGVSTGSGARIQKTEEVVLAQAGSQTFETKEHFAGWLALKLPEGRGIQVGLAGFRAQFPKAYRWSRNELQLDLWAAEGGNFDWVEGVGKTHQLTLVYGSAAAGEAALAARGPILANAAPAWYAQSGAFGRIDAAPGGLPEVEATLATHMKDVVVNRVGLGFENYGDHSSNGYVKGTFLWDNNEYDVPAGCLAHFARTGDREALQLGLASALHYLDVDTIHYSSQHADWARAERTHSHALFGHHTAQGPDFHHAGYVQGLIWYSYLTGEPVGIEGARGIADWVVNRPRIHTSTMERFMGHPLMTLNDVYEATGDEKYLRAAAALVDQALKWEHPRRSGFLAPITESSAYCSGSTFCSGLLPSALMKFNDWARLPEIDAMLARVAQWTLTDVWQPPMNIMHKGGSPRETSNPQYISSHLRLMTHVYGRTHDPLFLVVPRLATTAGFGSNAQPFGPRATGLVFNYLPWLIAELRKAGDPEPDPELQVAGPAGPVLFAPGGKTSVAFVLKNTGREPLTELRASFHSRLDWKITPPASVPSTLAAGESVELTYEVQAPADINLTCAYNRLAYGHWSALSQRSGRARLAHQAVSLSLAEAAEPGAR